MYPPVFFCGAGATKLELAELDLCTAGLGAGATVFDVASTGLSFFTGTEAGLEAPSPAVPRYGMEVVEIEGLGFTEADGAGFRTAPLVGLAGAGPSLRCVLICAFSMVLEALRFRACGSDGLFDGTVVLGAGLGTGRGDPEVSLCAGEGADGVLEDGRSICEIRSLKSYESQPCTPKIAQLTHTHGGQ
jgi:hypothetical protein